MMVKPWLILLSFFPFGVAIAQAQGEIRFYKPDELKLDVARLKPHKIELKEMSFASGKAQLQAYRYVTLDHIQAFGEKQLIINWEGLTAFGTGMDYNAVSAKDLSLYLRITPSGIPLGYFLESRAFANEANIVRVNPDVDFHPELKALSSSKVSMEQQPSKTLPFKTYNSIILPYVLACMDLDTQTRFILPGYGPYLKAIFYYRIQVLGKTLVKDAQGKSYDVFEIESIKRPNLDEVKSLGKNEPGSRTVFYISQQAPYFIGREDFTLNEGGDKTLKLHWVLSEWQLLKVNMAKRQKEILQAWEQQKKATNLKIPWHQSKDE